jgi:polysaccharide pyruvyl transferase WcaK-like protein
VQKGKTGHRVGVFGHYGHCNLGDEAITEAVIQNLRSRWPTVRVTGFSMDPADTAGRYGIPAYPIRTPDTMSQANVTTTGPIQSNGAFVAKRSPHAPLRDFLKRFALLRTLVHSMRFLLRLPRELWRELVFLRGSYVVAKDIDFFLIAGSNQFLDSWGGVWGFPYTILKWTVIARLAGARVAFLSVGAGPIDLLWSRIMVRAALLLADYASFRDSGSRRLIDWFGSGGGWHVYPDLAQSLQFERSARKNENSRPVVGINPMPVYDRRFWNDPDSARYARYVGQLARFASRLMREHYPVFFFATQSSDEAVISDVIAGLDADITAMACTPGRVRRSKTVAEVMQVIESADLVVATRFHGTVLALHAHRPVLGICYYRKTREVLEEMGQEAYAVDLDEIEDAELWRVFEVLASRCDEEARAIERKGEEVRALLAAQYDLVLDILAAPHASSTSTARERMH